jgi:LysR family glycine cleavage system transcriptional activator
MGGVRVLHPHRGTRLPSLSKLPPLTALRTFVVTARHLSFTRAGSELHVTPAAVGQQIRQLEAHLGRALFERNGRQLSLTAAGEAIAPALSESFEQMLSAVALLLSGEGDPLSVSVEPSFASKWLTPRLGGFRLLCPDLEISVNASLEVADFSSGEIDCAIRYGRGNYQGVVVEKLLAEAVFPVASPSLLSGKHALRRPQDLRYHVLLHDDSPEADSCCPNWASWLQTEGLNLDSPGIRFNQSALVLEAAAAGQGVALAKAQLAERDLRAGRLMQLFGKAQSTSLFYFFVAPRHKLRLPRVQAFREWLMSEADDSAQMGNPRPVARLHA